MDLIQLVIDAGMPTSTASVLIYLLLKGRLEERYSKRFRSDLETRLNVMHEDIRQTKSDIRNLKNWAVSTDEGDKDWLKR